MFFYRDSNNNEVDLLFQDGRFLKAVEIKYSATYNSSLIKNLKKMIAMTPDVIHAFLAYNGKHFALSENITAINYIDIEQLFSEEEAD